VAADIVGLLIGLGLVLAVSAWIAGSKAWRALLLIDGICGLAAAGAALFLATGKQHTLGLIVGGGLVLTIALWTLGWKPGRLFVLLGATGFAAALGFVSLAPSRWGIALGLLALSGVVQLTARWGWSVVLAACSWPGVVRWRRMALAAVGLGWAPLGLYSIAQQRWAFPEELGPPPGFHLVERANYNEWEQLWTGCAFERARYASPDTRTPKAHVLAQIEARMAKAGWLKGERMEASAEVSDRLGPGGRWDSRSDQDERLLRALQARGYPPERAQAMRSDPGLSLLTFSRPTGTRHDATFLIYDLPEERVIDVRLSGDPFD